MEKSPPTPGLSATVWQPHRNSFKRGAKVKLEILQGSSAHVHMCECIVTLLTIRGIESC